jgi:hypothetical protein
MQSSVLCNYQKALFMGDQQEVEGEERAKEEEYD